MSNLRDAWRARQAEARDAIRRDEVLVPQVVASRMDAPPEPRDPLAATLSTKYQTPGAAQVPEWDAEAAIRQAYLIDVVVARCTQIRAQTIASVPFRAGPNPDKPADHNPNSPLARLLGPAPGGPAPKLSSQVWWEWVVAQRIVTGRWGSEIEADDTGTPIALWPLASAYLSAVPTASGSDWWQGFTYGRDKQKKNLSVDQVLYGWDPSLLDFREPYSVLQSARLAVSVAIMAARYNYSFLKNDARPAAIVVTEEFDNEEDYRRFKHGWQSEYGGPDNAGKMRFLEVDPVSQTKPSEALNVFQLGLSQKDSRLLEQEKAALEHVAIAMGVPWSKLDASGRTFDNASQEDLSFWETTILTDLTKFADEINNQLAPRLGSDVGWFDLSNVRALRPQSKFARLVDGLAAHDRAIVKTNEIRDEIGLPPIDGGDDFTPRQLAALQVPPAGAPLAPAQGYPLPVAAAVAPGEERVLELGGLDDSDLDHPAAPPVPLALPVPARAAAGEQRALLTHTHAHAHSNGTIHTHQHTHAAGTPDHSHFDQVTHAHTHPETLAAPATEQRAPVESPEQRRARLWNASNAAVTTLESRWAKSMRRLFERQRKAVLSRLEGNRGRRVVERRATPDELFDPAHWEAETEDEVAALYEAVASAAFTRMAGQFGVSFDIEAPYAQDFIKTRANQLAGQVTDTTYQAIKDTLAEGVAAGESIPDLAARIGHVFDVASDTRATTIARTEVISAYGGSTRLAGNEMPADVLGGFEWIATQDDRTRDDHAEADGQVIASDEAFDVGGEQLAYPGDPSGDPGNTVNCRCALISLTPDEVPARAVATGQVRVPVNVATALIGLLGDGPIDELAVRRALTEAAA